MQIYNKFNFSIAFAERRNHLEHIVHKSDIKIYIESTLTHKNGFVPEINGENTNKINQIALLEKKGVELV